MATLTASSPSAVADAAHTVPSFEFSPFLDRTAPSPPRPYIRWLGFGLFLLATAVLLLRPADLFESLQYVPIYQTLVILCLALSIPRLLRQLFSASPANAITLLVLGIGASIVLSHLARGSLYDVRVGGSEFFKLFIYYLLVVAWVDTPVRMRRFVILLIACCLTLTILAWLEYDGRIQLSSLKLTLQTDTDPDSGSIVTLRRLAGAGIFGDPNDLCLLLVTAAALCAALYEYRPIGKLRFGMAVPLCLFGYAIMLTASRGGFLALMGGGATILFARIGKARATLTAIVIVPFLLLIFSGRQTHAELSDPEDTFQTRLDHWSESITLFSQSPVFGCGQDQQVELCGQVAHNSFIQCFAELGFLGGTCFLGAFLLTIRGLSNTASYKINPELARVRPYILGIIVGYGVGLFALSRAYTASTYLVIGIGAAYINLMPPAIPMRLDVVCLRRLSVASILFIGATYIFVRFMSV